MLWLFIKRRRNMQGLIAHSFLSGMMLIGGTGHGFTADSIDLNSTGGNYYHCEDVAWNRALLHRYLDASVRSAARIMPLGGSGSECNDPINWFAEIESSKALETPSTVNVEFAHGNLISAIRSSLSLQIKELAHTLDVSRQTVYSWIRGENEPQAANRKRLQDIYAIARYWDNLSEVPLGANLRVPSLKGNSILDLLSADTIDPDEIFQRMRSFMAIDERPKSRMREIAAMHGLQVKKTQDAIGEEFLTVGRIDEADDN
jgi:DNA-binding transcriptional regulator YiaG